jgi:hypothetical protein
MKNLGATCWLNALIQCLRVSKEWSGTSEFHKLVRSESDNKTEFLEKELTEFKNEPSDSQEALLYILDKIGDKDFEGEVTQTVVYPGGKSVTKEPCTVWFHQNKSDVISDYVDSNGKVYNVAVVCRELTRIPKILVTDSVEEYQGKQLVGIVVWGMGHYVAYVKKPDGEWWYLNDDAEPRKMNDAPIIHGKIPGLVAFFINIV